MSFNGSFLRKLYGHQGAIAEAGLLDAAIVKDLRIHNSIDAD